MLFDINNWKLLCMNKNKTWLSINLLFISGTLICTRIYIHTEKKTNKKKHWPLPPFLESSCVFQASWALCYSPICWTPLSQCLYSTTTDDNNNHHHDKVTECLPTPQPIWTLALVFSIYVSRTGEHFDCSWWIAQIIPHIRIYSPLFFLDTVIITNEVWTESDSLLFFHIWRTINS